MKRIYITYGGIGYTIAHADLDDLKATLLNAHLSGTPVWLRVNHGEGSYLEADLLIAPGIGVAITGIDAN